MSSADSPYSKDLFKHSQRVAPVRAHDLRLMKHPAEPIHPDHNLALLGSGVLPGAYNRANAKNKGSRSSGTRKCDNCGISQTRQWVRGEAQVWLCHSCGQFWRKNGYSRPEELWNRPTFRRCSRKRRGNSPSQDQEKKSKPAKGVREASSSFMNGKKMVECGERLPPVRKSKNSPTEKRFDPVKDLSSANLRLTGNHHQPPTRGNGGGAPISNMIHSEHFPPSPPSSTRLPPVSQLLQKAPFSRDRH